MGKGYPWQLESFVGLASKQVGRQEASRKSGLMMQDKCSESGSACKEDAVKSKGGGGKTNHTKEKRRRNKAKTVE